MQAVIREVPEAWLAERARLGLDVFDEMWEGVLHMVPAPGYVHQMVGSGILSFLASRLAERGISMLYETGVHRPGSEGQDFRIPDLVFFRTDRSDLIVPRGLEGAPLAVLEILSPNDETYDKFPFWANLGVAEIIVVDPDPRRVEIYRLAGQTYVAVSADAQGRAHAATIDVRWSTTEESRLRLEHVGAVVEI